jgi:hypothetical protein
VSRPARYILLAQAVFFASLTVCALLDPQGLHDNHGWSYYEERSRTIAPYLFGVVACVLLILYAASLVERSVAPAGLPRALRLLAAFLLLNLATPDTINVVFYWGHDLTSTLLFLYELGFALWLVRAVWRTRLGYGLVALQFVGGLVAMFSQLHVISHLGFGIFVFQASFCVLLVAATARLRETVGGEAMAAEDVAAQAATR